MINALSMFRILLILKEDDYCAGEFQVSGRGAFLIGAAPDSQMRRRNPSCALIGQLGAPSPLHSRFISSFLVIGIPPSFDLESLSTSIYPFPSPTSIDPLGAKAPSSPFQSLIKIKRADWF